MRSGLLFLATATAIAATIPTPRERSFAFEYSVTVKDLPAGARFVDLWVPVPHDDPYQKVSGLKIETPFSYSTATDPDGNVILHLRVPRPAGGSVPLTMRFDAIRKEHIQLLTTTEAKPESKAVLDRWLKPDRLVPLDDTIRKWAREVVDAAHATTDVKMESAIYNN